MLIEYRLYPKLGTCAHVDGVQYHFRPSSDYGGRCVARVDDEEHAARLLDNPHCYQPFDAPVVESSSEVDVPAGQPMTREQMVAAYEARFGRKPHGLMADEKLRAKLAEG